jgi:integrase
MGEEQLTLTNFLRQMIRSDRNLSAGSVTKHTVTVNAHIDGTDLGRTDIRFADEEKVEEFWNRLDIGDGALRGVKQVLAMAFNRARKRGIIDVSPLDRLDLSVKARDPGDIEPLTAVQVEKLADNALTTRDRLAVLLMGYCGVRAGEVAGLRVPDLDFERCRINVRKQVAQGKVADLKSKAARRSIGVGCSITKEIEAYVQDGGGADGYLFKSRLGGLWHPKSVNEAVKAAAKRAGIVGAHAHLLRHTAISLLIVEKKMNPKAIQQFAGHSNVTIILNTYSHLFDYGAETVAEAMEEIREDARR